MLPYLVVSISADSSLVQVKEEECYLYFAPFCSIKLKFPLIQVECSLILLVFEYIMSCNFSVDSSVVQAKG